MALAVVVVVVVAVAVVPVHLVGRRRRRLKSVMALALDLDFLILERKNNSSWLHVNQPREHNDNRFNRIERAMVTGKNGNVGIRIAYIIATKEQIAESKSELLHC